VIAGFGRRQREGVGMGLDATATTRAFDRLRSLAPPSPRTPSRLVAAVGDAAPAYDRLALWGVGLPLFAEVFIQKVGIPLGGTNQISATIPLGFAGLGLLILTGRAVVDVPRLILYAAMVGAILLSQMLGGSVISTSSLILMTVTYVIYVFTLKDHPGNFRATIQLYQRMTIVIAVVAVVQYAGQYVLPYEVVFPLESALGPFLIKNFNHTIPITYGATIYKSNGVFLAEPSYLSQAMALSFIIERLFFRRIGYQIAYLAGLTVSYSGTGMLLLAIAGPILLYRTGALRLLIILLPVAAILLLVGNLMHLDVIAGRAGELNSENSSGFARFVSIFYLLSQFIFIDPSRFFFGMGAGSIETVVGEVTYLSHDPTWGKLLFEYGLLGVLGFFPYFFYSIFANSPSRFLAACLAFAYFFLGGNLLGPFYNFLIVALVAWQRPDPTLLAPLARTARGAPRRITGASHAFFRRPAPAAFARQAGVPLPLEATTGSQPLSRFCP
jgi:hypothetical protein